MDHLSIKEQHSRYIDQASWTKSIRNYLFNRTAPQTQKLVLEVGSGTGAVMQALQEEGKFLLTGVDIDRSVLRFSQKFGRTCHLIQATGDDLPFPDDCFNISYCHYLLLWVSQPKRILSEMCRVTNPGGCVIALAEPDHQSRLDYPPLLDRLGEQQTQALQDQGIDIRMGRKLSAFFQQVGLKDVEIGILGALWKTKANRSTKVSEWMTIQSDLVGMLSTEKLSAYQDIDQSAWENGRRVLFIPTFYAIGIVK